MVTALYHFRLPSPLWEHFQNFRNLMWNNFVNMKLIEDMHKHKLRSKCVANYVDGNSFCKYLNQTNSSTNQSAYRNIYTAHLSIYSNFRSRAINNSKQKQTLQFQLEFASFTRIQTFLWIIGCNWNGHCWVNAT